MCARYSKSYSNYILRKRHQNINGATIYERDWVTIGGVHRLSKDKIPYYDYGNFIFTTSNVHNMHNRHRMDSEVSHFTYDDVKNSTDVVNNVKPNVNSDDIRTFAYYGSAVELVRVSIENIIAEFPAQIKAINQQLGCPIKYDAVDKVYDDYYTFKGYIVSNPFKIDLHHCDVVLGKYDNPLRFMTYSYNDYEISTDGGKNWTNISNYNNAIKYADDLNDNPLCNEWNVRANETTPNYKPIVTVTIGGVDLRGFQVDGEIVFLTDNANLVIKPKDDIIKEYFNSLDGFEKQLLNTNTKPLYKNTFKTPVMGKLNYKYINKDYIFPSDGYCIDIENPSYSSYVQELINLATTYDELWTDNLYRNMTHEAIKNFDWTYTRDYMEGEEQNNIDGGERVKKLLNVFGRVMDDVKRYVDTIKLTNKVSYNSFNDMPNALLSDKLELNGWNAVSTIPTFLLGDDGLEDIDTLSIDEKFLSENKCIWYNSTNSNDIKPNIADIDFMKRFLLASKRISMSKGTVNSIEMIMALFGFKIDEDYKLIEEYYETKPLASETNLEKIEEINFNKSISHDSYELFAGLPLKLVNLDGGDYIIPYYDSNKIYDGDLYFQQKGGWGKTDDDRENGINYLETISYLHILSNVSDLLNVNSREVQSGDIYYVVDFKYDIMSYYEVVKDSPIKPEDVTGFFMFKEGANDASKYSSWVIVTTENEKVKYLDSIISYSIGNNPHVGYGKYDCGKEYIEYMKQPFKYAVDNYQFYSDDSRTEAEKLTFDNLETPIYDNDKIILYNKDKEKYYINSKVLIIRNNIGNNLYKKYFMNIILPYLMQTIPSTTILILENFKIND